MPAWDPAPAQGSSPAGLRRRLSAAKRHRARPEGVRRQRPKLRVSNTKTIGHHFHSRQSERFDSQPDNQEWYYRSGEKQPGAPCTAHHQRKVLARQSKTNYLGLQQPSHKTHRPACLHRAPAERSGRPPARSNMSSQGQHASGMHLRQPGKPAAQLLRYQKHSSQRLLRLGEAYLLS